VFDFPLAGFEKSGIENTLSLAFAQSSVVATENEEDGEFGFRQPVQYIHRLITGLKRVQSPVFALHKEQLACDSLHGRIHYKGHTPFLSLAVYSKIGFVKITI
jgi:hypothetical protein